MNDDFRRCLISSATNGNIRKPVYLPHIGDSSVRDGAGQRFPIFG